MVNGHNIAHGGFIFTLANSTFAFACNTYNQRTVARKARSPSSLREARRRLVAPRAKSRAAAAPASMTSGHAGDVVIAEFRGHSRTIAGTLLPASDAKK